MIAADVFGALGVIPALSGARCRGRASLFDPPAKGEDPAVVGARHAQALGLCEHCPALTRFGDWFDSLPKRKRPHGVVAGQISLGAEDREHRPPGRPRRSVS